MRYLLRLLDILEDLEMIESSQFQVLEAITQYSNRYRTVTRINPITCKTNLNNSIQGSCPNGIGGQQPKKVN